MQTSSQFKRDTSMALLLMGKPGAGKTCTAFQFPKPWFCDWADSNLRSAVETFPALKDFYFDTVDRDDEGKEVAVEKRWERASDLLKKAAADPRVETLVDDALSMLQNALCDHIIAKGSAAENPLVIGGVKVMTRSMWSAFKDLLVRRIIYARSSGKRYVLVAHEAVDADEMTGVKLYRPALSGQLGNSLASLFTDWWSVEVDPNADKKKYANGVRHYVRTVPNTRMTLKNSCGLPADFDFTWEAFSRVQDERAKAAAATVTTQPLDKAAKIS